MYRTVEAKYYQHKNLVDTHNIIAKCANNMSETIDGCASKLSPQTGWGNPQFESTTFEGPVWYHISVETEGLVSKASLAAFPDAPLLGAERSKGQAVRSFSGSKPQSYRS